MKLLSQILAELGLTQEWYKNNIDLDKFLSSLSMSADVTMFKAECPALVQYMNNIKEPIKNDIYSYYVKDPVIVTYYDEQTYLSGYILTSENKFKTVLQKALKKLVELEGLYSYTYPIKNEDVTILVDTQHIKTSYTITPTTELISNALSEQNLRSVGCIGYLEDLAICDVDEQLTLRILEIDDF